METSKKSKKPKCYFCKKKLTMIEVNFLCKCEKKFCQKHLNPHSHNCSYNYVKEKQISILLASHNMNEVTRLCSSILMMKEGVIIDSGKPEELIKKHGRKNLEEVFLKLSRNENELY